MKLIAKMHVKQSVVMQRSMRAGVSVVFESRTAATVFLIIASGLTSVGSTKIYNIHVVFRSFTHHYLQKALLEKRGLLKKTRRVVI